MHFWNYRMQKIFDRMQIFMLHPSMSCIGLYFSGHLKSLKSSDWRESCDVKRTARQKAQLGFIMSFFFSGCSFSIADIGFPLNFYWFPSENSQKHVFVCKKEALWIRVELFALLYVWHHNFLASHSILMILDAQKSRDHPLSNGSKNINFRRGKIFFRTRCKKVLV